MSGSGAAQRLIFPGTSDASGNISFTIPAPGGGVVFTGTLNVPLAPLAGAFTVYNGIGGIALYNFDSDNPYGAVQQFPGELLVVKGTGLAVSTIYNLVFTGYQTDLAHAPVLQTPYGSRTTINNSSSFPVQIVTPTPPSAVAYTNEVTIASTGVAQQLPGGSFPLTVGLAVYALKANVAKVRVAGSNVSSSSYGIEAGTGLVFPISNVNIIWIEGTSGDIVEVFGQ